MRILFVNDWAGSGGGIESHISLVSQGLREAGDEVRLLTSGAGDGSQHADYVAYGAKRALPQAMLQVANPLAARAARRAVADFRPDVAHVSMFEMHLSPSVVEALRPVPVVLSIAYYKPICPNGLKLLPDDSRCTVQQGLVCWRGGCVGLAHWLRDRPRYALIARSLRSAAAVVTCSRMLQDELAQAGVASEFAVWPTRRPEDGFRREPATDPLFVFTGRLAREKGLATLFHALAQVRRRGVPARVRIVGDGELRPELEDLVMTLRLGDVVEWTGWVRPERVEDHLGDAWALVAPSLWAEPLGLTALEALVRGVPVIASSTGGFAETVEDGRTGILVPNGDVGALAQSLEDVASRRAFPELTLPAHEIERIRAIHDPVRHVTWLRQVFARIVGSRSA